MSKKVLHVYKTFLPDTHGGIETTIQELATGCRGKGWEPIVLVASARPSAEPLYVQGVEVHQAQTTFSFASTPFSIQMLIKVYKIAQHADIIHVHQPFPFADFICFFLAKKIPTIVTYHSDVVTQKFLKFLYFGLQLLFLKRVDRIVCTSPNYKESSSTLRRFRSKTEVIPLGISSVSGKTLANLETRITDDFFTKPYFLFIGVLRKYKGILNMIEAARLCGHRMIIAGDGPELEKAKKLINKKRIENVEVIGHVNNLEKHVLLTNCIGLLLPSKTRAEAFGISLLEAALYAKPLITTELSTGTSFVNIHNVTGYVVTPNDPNMLAAAMDNLWFKEDVRNNFGMAAKERWSELFTSQQMVENYCSLYDGVIQFSKTKRS